MTQPLNLALAVISYSLRDPAKVGSLRPPAWGSAYVGSPAFTQLLECDLELASDPPKKLSTASSHSLLLLSTCKPTADESGMGAKGRVASCSDHKHECVEGVESLLPQERLLP